MIEESKKAKYVSEPVCCGSQKQAAGSRIETNEVSPMKVTDSLIIHKVNVFPIITCGTMCPMDTIKNIIGGGIITVVIGGSIFTFTQPDVVDNFAEETGLSTEQADQYINNISEDELATFTEIGSELVTESTNTTEIANTVDCDTYEYEWESPTLTCPLAKQQIEEMAQIEKSVGEAFIQLDAEDASTSDIQKTITLLDQLNTSYSQEISFALYGEEDLQEVILTNQYNKAILQATLESTGSQ